MTLKSKMQLKKGTLIKKAPAPKDPWSIYPELKGLDPRDFQLPAQGLTPEQHQAALDKFSNYLDKHQARYLGYQDNQQLDYAADLQPYLNCHINNIADPFVSGNLTTNTKIMERAVLDYYADLWNANLPHNPRDPDSYWGYVLSMGSTEGNLYGLWNGRDYLAGKALIEDASALEAVHHSPSPMRERFIYQDAPERQASENAYTPIAFFSGDSHYSIIKAMRILSIKTFYELGQEKYPGENPLDPGEKWPYEVPALEDGSLDIEALEKLVEFFAAKGYPILICFNYGTTFKGAYDNVEEAGKRLIPILKKYNLYERQVHGQVRNGFWFHVDGALGASFMPFVEMAYNRGLIERRGSNFDFRLSYVHSLVTSGHKWNGAPWPCGVYMTKVKFQLRPPRVEAYIASPDTTFAGSRNGFSSMLFWDYLAKNSYDAQIERVVRIQKTIKYAIRQLRKLGEELKQDLWVEHTPLSLSIRFKRVNERMTFKYSLSGSNLWKDGKVRRYSNIFIMDHVTPEVIDDFIKDLRRDSYPFPSQS